MDLRRPSTAPNLLDLPNDILNLIVILADKFNYHPSSKKIFIFTANGDHDRKSQSMDLWESSPNRYVTTELLYIWLREHYGRGADYKKLNSLS